MFERRLYYHIDWALLAAILALCALGVVMIDATTVDPTRGNSPFVVTQLYAIVIGLAAMVFMLALDYRTFTDKSHLIYIFLLALLVYVMFLGSSIGNYEGDDAVRLLSRVRASVRTGAALLLGTDMKIGRAHV